MDCTRKIHAWMLVILAASSLTAFAQFEQGEAPPPREPQPQQPSPQAPQPQQQPSVVATVNGDSITRGEVQATLQSQLQGRQIDPQTAQQMQKQVIDNLIEARLVEQYVLEKGPDVPPQEVNGVVNRLQQQLAAQDMSLDAFLASQGHTAESFQDRIKGSLAWQKFQQQELTDENLERYFQERQQQFNAENFEEARKAVANAYVGELWQQIIRQMKPKAEIRVAPTRLPSPQNPADPAAPPRRSP